MEEMKIIEREPPAGVKFSHFESEVILPQIMSLVEKDLSEPYSVFTYRYFVLGWPELTIMAKEESTDELIGVIVCKVDRGNSRKRLRGYIAMLAVDKTHRNRGIGSYLAYKAILTMKNMNCDEVVLETEFSNTGALALYDKLGFIRDKRLCRYYLNGGDAFRLKLWFTQPSWDDGFVSDIQENGASVSFEEEKSFGAQIENNKTENKSQMQNEHQGNSNAAKKKEKNQNT